MPTTPNLEIAKPLTLPCGIVLPNRLVKAAMSEEMGHGDHLPSGAICALYRTWAQGNWGMILTGAVHVDATYSGSPTALTIDASTPPSPSPPPAPPSAPGPKPAVPPRPSSKSTTPAANPPSAQGNAPS